MNDNSIYNDITRRTGGDIYIGVVGPVRTGKSTFIKKFMETLVIPNINGDYDRERARDEMPQSAAGKTVMTTEPKFIPDEAVTVNINGNISFKVKMVDCVGYIVPDALGQSEDGQERMVLTPWSEEAMPFREAAELGTRKVIREHSTIGMLVTTDGTIGEIPRAGYVEAEERVAAELRQLNKPFAVILNSADPSGEAAVALAYELEEKYGAPVALVNCTELDQEDIKHILGLVLHEFPVKQIGVALPAWLSALDGSHKLRESITDSIKKCAASIKKIGDINGSMEMLTENEYIERVSAGSIDMGTGCAAVALELDGSLYYRVMSELTGFEISGEEQLITLMRSLSHIKNEYDKIEGALLDVNTKGYGIVMPGIEDLKLEEPEIVKHAGGHGVRLRASAQSIHIERNKQKYTNSKLKTVIKSGVKSHKSKLLHRNL